MWIIWKYVFLYSIKSFLDICKSLVDAELIYNLSSLDNFDIIHLLRSDWSNMANQQILHPHVILFLLLIGFIYFVMYLQSNVSPIHTFPSTILYQKNLLHKLIISCHCVALILIFEVNYFIFYKSTIDFEKHWVFYIGGMYSIRVI